MIFWTDERVETLRKHWADGLSASQIAKIIGGCTRNAVIGKIHRLGFAGRAQPDRKISKGRIKTARRSTYTPRLPREEVQPPPPEIETGDPLHMITDIHALTDDVCRWPIGDPQEQGFGYCGRPSTSGPYCACHHARAYTVKPVRRRPVPSHDPAQERRDMWLAAL